MRATLNKRWNAWVERMLPPGLSEDDSLRSRLLVRAWTLSIVFAVASMALYAYSAIWSQVVVTAFLVLAAVPMLWLHRRGLPFGALVHASMAVASLVFGFSAVAQRPFDSTSMALLLLIPMLSALLLGRRGALTWLAISLVWSACISLAADRDWLLDFVDPTPALSHVINFSIGLVLSGLFAHTFAQLQQTALEKLRAADRARSAFLANISHEIRTPMNGVLGMTEVMLLESLAPAQQEQLHVIQRSGRTLVALINDLLDITKMEAGKLSLEQADFTLDTVLSDVHALLAPNAAAHGLTLRFTKADDVPSRVRGDALRLSQVLTNLVSNAVKFTPKGEVRLEVRRVGGNGLRCAFAVIDTGVGIAADVVPRLFTAFQQGDTSTTRRFGGSGLGLALSQQLVNLMGGTIALESSPGVGSTFRFEVDFTPAQSEAIAPVIESTTSPVVRKAVLVVDDNPINLKVAMALVARAGFPVDGAINGRAALEAVQHGDYGLVLMDCHMPEMDGFEATERIRALDGRLGRTPIVALTASAMPDELAQCRRVGMNSVLVKPVDYVKLQEVLRQAA